MRQPGTLRTVQRTFTLDRLLSALLPSLAVVAALAVGALLLLLVDANPFTAYGVLIGAHWAMSVV